MRWAGRPRLAVERRDLLIDVAIAVVLGIAAVVSVDLVHDDVLRFDPTITAPDRLSVYIAAFGTTLPLAVRRVFPLFTVSAACVMFVVGRFLLDVNEGASTVLACYLAIYSGALHGRWPWRTPVVAASVSLIAAEIVREVFVVEQVRDVALGIKVFTLSHNLVILALPWWLGEALRLRSVRERELMAQAEELRREREENAQLARFEERVRIARELHDVVAHHVSTMGVQAGAARRVMERSPDQAQAALQSIEDASRQAVHEMDQLLGFLRREDQVDRLAPQPGLDDLDDLLDQLRAAGLHADVQISGDRPALPATMELTIYRIVQEALTNVLKHSTSDRATVQVHFGHDDVELDVHDDGAPTGSAPAQHTGHGLIGMRERARLHGGELRAGAAAGRGFVVHANLPLEPRRS